MLYLENRVAIVTGGAKGMGEAICRKFASEGCTVVVNDLDLETARKVADEITAQGGSAIANKVDQTIQADVIASVEDTVSRYGKVDILINNAGGVAGMHGRGALGTFDMDEFERITDINMRGPLYYLTAVVPHMKKAMYGKIVNFSSIGAMNPVVSVIPYHASKGAIEAMTRNLAFELSTYNINVNVIIPGNIRTPFWGNVVFPDGMDEEEFFRQTVVRQVPIQRMGTSEDIAGAALFLSSGMSDFVTGQKIWVAGGSPDVNPVTVRYDVNI
ncbi:MAG: SDR family oxidoreductase [Clostridiales Family XIII bacterium]|jgi:NAD(P)-dependent dehydrogenase (short-subunit alcohol dehydrogenase family)|nr:SDR family oxidoreductase [Clostridiales Family XIII bacterium]